jgi:hypothetical protein
MGVHATQIEDDQERSRAQKERAKHQREDAEQGSHRT